MKEFAHSIRLKVKKMRLTDFLTPTHRQVNVKAD